MKTMPIRAEGKQTMARLIEVSQDGFVISGITGQHRIGTMSKAFQRLRKSLGCNEKQKTVFHSIRNAVINMLEEAQLPEATVAAITGHRYPTITFGLYSGGVSLAVKRAAIEKLSYTG